MKRKVYANVKMEVVRQVEFDVDIQMPNDEMENMALDIARREWGDFDEGEVVEMDWAENPALMATGGLETNDTPAGQAANYQEAS